MSTRITSSENRILCKENKILFKKNKIFSVENKIIFKENKIISKENIIYYKENNIMSKENKVFSRENVIIFLETNVLLSFITNHNMSDWNYLSSERHLLPRKTKLFHRVIFSLKGNTFYANRRSHRIRKQMITLF